MSNIDGILGLSLSTTSPFSILTSLSHTLHIDFFYFDFSDNKIHFDSFLSANALFNIKSHYDIEVDDVSNKWEIEIKRFIINSSYDICKDIKKYYSKCKLIIDSGSQYNSIPSDTLLNKFHTYYNRISSLNEIIIQITSERTLAINHTYKYVSNSLGKIIMGIEFITHHHIVFDVAHKHIFLANSSSYSELDNLIAKFNYSSSI